MKKKFAAAACLLPKICPQSWALVKIKNQFFAMKQSYFCNFDIKTEFLDPKNPHVTIFMHQNASEIKLQHYFQNSEAKSFVAKNPNCDNLKSTRDISKNFFLVLFCVILFKLKIKYSSLVTHGDKPF